ncbi:MAG: Maf-like protein [Chloroflexi bacterium]|nr:MAG: Maf-like protein [Chloroflexota bacterium]MBA4374923.1 septum formation protein Maf [Anaerolinea sp.]
MNVPEIVLASNSPRRREILSWTGLAFTTHPADVDETPKDGESPEDYVRRLAENKAHVSSGFAPFNGLVLAADTTVSDELDILGKPNDIEDARKMLLRLRGRTHQVHTAIVVYIPSKGITERALCSTAVRMRKYSDGELQAYLDTGDSMDKAGAYAIQHSEFRPVVKFSGCFASVMGFPLCHFERTLRRMGYGERKEIPYRCQDQLSYSCPIYKHVLNGEEVG